MNTCKLFTSSAFVFILFLNISSLMRTSWTYCKYLKCIRSWYLRYKEGEVEEDSYSEPCQCVWTAWWWWCRLCPAQCPPCAIDMTGKVSTVTTVLVHLITGLACVLPSHIWVEITSWVAESDTSTSTPGSFSSASSRVNWTEHLSVGVKFYSYNLGFYQYS